MANLKGSETYIDAHRGGGGGVVSSEKLSHKNAIKHEKGKKSGHPFDFLTTPSTPPQKKRIWPKPQGPPWISNYCVFKEKSSYEIVRHIRGRKLMFII